MRNTWKAHTQLDMCCCVQSKSSIRFNRFWRIVTNSTPKREIVICATNNRILKSLDSHSMLIHTMLACITTFIDYNLIGEWRWRVSLVREQQQPKNISNQTIKWFQELKSSDSSIDLRWLCQTRCCLLLWLLSHGMWTESNFYCDSLSSNKAT